DLVKEQIKVARGERLSFRQEDLKILGHAIEIRVYAEDPADNFLPDIGRLSTYRIPQGPGIRVDDAYEEGMDIPIYYDPMIAKLIAYGSDRSEAIERMKRAIEDYHITGVKTTLPFCHFVMQHEAFVSGKFDTHFVKNHYTPDMLHRAEPDEEMIAALLAVRSIRNNSIPRNSTSGEQGKVSRWKSNRLRSAD
ncbi:MAG TPA: biotin carboxylase, partial [Bacteroidia bacterium]|nr:biotin carboxylase [Bacteroidia bacterium]